MPHVQQESVARGAVSLTLRTLGVSGVVPVSNILENGLSGGVYANIEVDLPLSDVLALDHIELRRVVRQPSTEEDLTPPILEVCGTFVYGYEVRSTHIQRIPEELFVRHCRQKKVSMG